MSFDRQKLEATRKVERELQGDKGAQERQLRIAELNRQLLQAETNHIAIRMELRFLEGLARKSHLDKERLDGMKEADTLREQERNRLLDAHHRNACDGPRVPAGRTCH